MARRRRRDGDELRKGQRVEEEEVACSGFCRAGLLINFGASPIGRFSFCYWRSVEAGGEERPPIP